MSTHTASRYVYVLLVTALASLALFVFLWNLGAHSISLKSDEVIYVRVSQGITNDGALFPLRHGSVPTFEKPPLKIWLSAVLPFLLGESNFTFRLLDGALGVLSVGLVVLIARGVFRAPIAALCVGFLTLGMPEWVISHHGFRRAVLDGLLTVSTLCMAWATWSVIERARDGRRCEFFLWVITGACSAAILTKSVAGFVPLLCSGISLLVCAPSVARSRRAFILTVPFLVFALLVGALAGVGGVKAIKVFLGVEIVTRVFSGFEGHNTGDRSFYWWYLFVRGAAAPRLLLGIGAVGTIIAAVRDLRFRFIGVWGILPVILYSCAASKAPWYLNPFLPFVCMIAVFGSMYLISGMLRKVRLRWGIAVGFAILAVVALPPYFRAMNRHVRHVLGEVKRIEVDTLIESLRQQYRAFAIVDGALSGRSNPRKGRFNVEGIYRETLKPDLLVVERPEYVVADPLRVFLVKEDSLPMLPPGWREVGRAAPFVGRSWTIVAVVYPAPGGA